MKTVTRYQMVSGLFAPPLSLQLEPLSRFSPFPFHSAYTRLFPLNSLTLAPLYFPGFCVSHKLTSEDVELGTADERDKITPYLKSTS